MSDAVAASAAFPSFGWIRVRSEHKDLYLSDGGLVDNSGLLAVYANVYQRRLFESTTGRLKRIFVFEIDAAPGVGENVSLIDTVMAIYDRGQSVMSTFVIPHMARVFSEQVVGDLLTRPEWKDFSTDDVLTLAYSTCRNRASPPVATAFSISAEARRQLDEEVQRCWDLSRVADAVQGKLIHHRPYTGVFSASDEAAHRTLVKLAQLEYISLAQNGRWSDISELVTAAFRSAMS